MDDFEKKIAEEIAKQIPIKDIYEDVAKPVSKATGEVLGLIPRAINCALLPLNKWIMYKEFNLEQTKLILESKLKNIDPNEIVQPEPYVAIPALQAISYCEDNEDLRNLYANLLASSMSLNKKKYVHPAFVEIIKQLSPDEAKILKVLAEEGAHPIIWLTSCETNGMKSSTHMSNFTLISVEAKCEILSNTASYIDNLSRLKIIDLINDAAFSEKTVYSKLINHPEIVQYQHNKLPEGRMYKIQEGLFRVTAFGRLFCKICVD